MLRAFGKTVKAVESTYNASLRQPLICYRSVSTNSAIQRGIRRSRPDTTRVRQREEVRSTGGGAVRRGGHRDGSQAFQRGRDVTTGREGRREWKSDRPEGPRRPNHQQRQDVEDIEASAFLRKDRTTPRQRRYARNGSGDTQSSSSFGRGSSTGSSRRSWNSDEQSRNRSGGTSNYVGAEKRTFSESPTQSRFGTGNTSSQSSHRKRSEIYASTKNGSSGGFSTRSKDSTSLPAKDYNRTRDGSKGYEGRTPNNTNSSERSFFRTHASNSSTKLSPARSVRSSGDFKRGREDEDTRTSTTSFDSRESQRKRDFSPKIERNLHDYQASSRESFMNRKDLRARKFSSNTDIEDDRGSRQLGQDEQRNRSERVEFDGEEPRSDFTAGGNYQPKEDHRTFDKNTPLSVPYTTPASEFLYGTSVVLAALRTARRKLYKLYMYQGEHREAQDEDRKVENRALARGVEVVHVKNDGIRLMDKMSAGRPHNGYILEASPLSKLPAASLMPVEGRNTPLSVELEYQSREEEEVNGTNPIIKYRSDFPRYPFILMLDGILDPGNLGAILRTAHFLGVDALALSSRHSAPLTPIALKSSAGASESLPLISLPSPASFVLNSQANGWKFYAAVAPDDSLSADSPSTSPVYTGNGNGSRSLDFARTGKGPVSDREPHRTSTLTLAALASSCPTRYHPTVLMLGAEGEGLRLKLRGKADVNVSIGGSWRQDEDGTGGVDSLNVSVAAGLLCDAFLRAPTVGRDLDKKGKRLVGVHEATEPYRAGSRNASENERKAEKEEEDWEDAEGDVERGSGRQVQMRVKERARELF